MNWYDRKIRSLDDLFKAALKRQQMSNPADGALGEDANHLALFQFGARIAQGMDDVAPVGGRDGNGLHQTEEPIEPSDVVILAVQHEAYEPWDGSTDKECIDEGNVVGNTQRRAL